MPGRQKSGAGVPIGKLGGHPSSPKVDTPDIARISKTKTLNRNGFIHVPFFLAHNSRRSIELTNSWARPGILGLRSRHYTRGRQPRPFGTVMPLSLNKKATTFHLTNLLNRFKR